MPKVPTKEAIEKIIARASRKYATIFNNLRRKLPYVRDLRDQLTEQARLQEDLKKVRRGMISGWIFAVIGVILIGFGYTLYDSGLSYSGIFLMIMGIVSIGFGSILVRYSRKIV